MTTRGALRLLALTVLAYWYAPLIWAIIALAVILTFGDLE